MSDKRIKLDNALHQAMLQRADLKRRLRGTRQQLSPSALINRGKLRVGEKIDDAALGAQQQLKRHRIPLTIAAVAGIGYALRGPIRELAPKVWEQLRAMTGQADAADDQGSDAQADPAPPPPVENDDEDI